MCTFWHYWINLKLFPYMNVYVNVSKQFLRPNICAEYSKDGCVCALNDFVCVCKKSLFISIGHPFRSLSQSDHSWALSVLFNFFNNKK